MSGEGQRVAATRAPQFLIRVDPRLAVLFRRDLLDACLVIFLADVVTGMISPTFSLYARSMGASLSFLGLLAATVGLVRLTLSIPLGVLSDWNRKWVLVGGMLVFMVSAAGLAVSPSAAWLFLPNALFGIGQIATFTLGIAYLGDRLPAEQRGLGIALYTTCMGLGFGVGPALAGWTQQEFGFGVTYELAAVIALAGAVYAAVQLKGRAVHASTQRVYGGTSLRALLADRRIWAACLAQVLISLTFNGVIVTFFPVLANEGLGLSAGVVGGIFAIRAFASTVLRLPAGLAELTVEPRILMIGALVIEAATLVAIQATQSVVLLVILLAIEGISFGLFLTSGQEFVIRLAGPRTRGGAMGIYATAGSLGQSGGTLILGFIAQSFGIRWVFLGVAAVVMFGLLAVVPLSLETRQVEVRSRA